MQLIYFRFFCGRSNIVIDTVIERDIKGKKKKKKKKQLYVKQQAHTPTQTEIGKKIYMKISLKYEKNEEKTISMACCKFMQ